MLKLSIVEEIPVLEELFTEYLKKSNKVDLFEIQKDNADEEHPDMVVLDTSNYNWEDILEKGVNNGRTILVSSFNICHAPRANNLGAFGFLLRPFSLDELDIVFERFFQDSKRLISKPQTSTSKTGVNLLGINSSEGISVVKEAEILRIEADKNYSVVHLLTGERIICSKPLKHFEHQLSPELFVRVHKSHMVNIGKVKWIETMAGSKMRLENGDEIPVSRRKKSTLISNLQII